MIGDGLAREDPVPPEQVEGRRRVAERIGFVISERMPTRTDRRSLDCGSHCRGSHCRGSRQHVLEGLSELVHLRVDDHETVRLPWII